MAKTLNTTARKTLDKTVTKLQPEERPIAEPLISEATPEDLNRIDNDILATAIGITADGLEKHKKGKSIVQVVNTENESEDQATIISVINENMPFLFDSILGQINAHTTDVNFLVHPILDVKHEGKKFEVIDKTRPGLVREKTMRTSVIVAIIKLQNESARKKLEQDIKSTLLQVNAAVSDWHPMQKRMERSS
ncbi:hypothetical protein GQR58_026795 [Nymphon striatum]|nr:hypothetical protein GQR58_026795 [Nymphon striatum]